MSLGPLEPKFWLKFAALTGLEADLGSLLPGDHQAELKEKVASVVASKTRAEWEAFCAEHDVLIEPALHGSEIVDDPQLQARQLFFDQEVNGETLKLFRTPVSDRDHVPGPSPKKGEHTRAIFAEAGFSAEEIDALFAAGAANDERVHPVLAEPGSQVADSPWAPKE